MLLVPIIHVGLTPFLQLAILSLVTYTVVDREIAASGFAGLAMTAL